MIGFYTLFKKEVLRFWKVGLQTVAAPMLTALLYQLIFSHAVGRHIETLPGVSYHAFLIPGLAMMSMLQNAFANASSSLIQSRLTGNLVFILLPPLSVRSFFGAYVGAAVLRGLLVGIGVVAVTAPFGLPMPQHWGWIALFALLGSAVMGMFGLLAGIVAEKFDQLAMFQNFLIMPLTFLSGVFYSIGSLPEFWQGVSRLNPVFYMIDGFRFGFFGVSDVSPWLSLSVVGAFAAAWAAGMLALLKSGWRLRS
ncbi:ABC transporter permease [Neisseria sp. ZJ106]|uniref:Transport permease protein n=1 Tax=Neisseria lisongii TaxID=2912188 RepID=A0AAW5AKB3_9NEIS|nr:ABC transporter permease [Neisseria lisongii]MCF7520874.1 ABC transporter permease [Neisseria lisongii]MCF7530532.1 ABC transporter permease [Neisseria lisongii]WCL71317.1 ABC transporter permease [Neisseria lisongii]